jgi:hypothetical protein
MKACLEKVKATEFEANQGKIGTGVEHCNPVPPAPSYHPAGSGAYVLHGVLKEVMLQESIRTDDQYGDQQLETGYCV